MPRKGWSTAPDGWVQIIRGPRRRRTKSIVRRSVAVSPEVVIKAAKKRVDGIEATLEALAAVGTTDSPEVQVLKDCLSRSEAICTRTTSRRPNQPDGVVPRKGRG